MNTLRPLIMLVVLAVALYVLMTGIRHGWINGLAFAGSNEMAQPYEEDATIKVKMINAEGELVGPIDSPKVVKTDEAWQAQLTAEQYKILRRAGTEQPFCGLLLDNKEAGVYTCAGCGLPLYSSDAKFKSGTGWPSFYAPVADENIAEYQDESYGMVRTEIRCARCDGHLGHVFDDGPPPTGKRHCLNSESLNFTPSEELSKMADPFAYQPKTDENGIATAVFAGGCFWCTEAVFQPLDGVSSVESGYAGGIAETADYNQVSTGSTGHAEVIKITYDPIKVSYVKLMELFFFIAHDPTQVNRQGNDVGTQYRSAVFYADEAQKAATEAYIKLLNEGGRFSNPIATTLEPLDAFYPAEKYHQDYVENNPSQPYVRSVAIPKVEKLKEHYGDILKEE